MYMYGPSSQATWFERLLGPCIMSSSSSLLSLLSLLLLLALLESDRRPILRARLVSSEVVFGAGRLAGGAVVRTSTCVVWRVNSSVRVLKVSTSSE